MLSVINESGSRFVRPPHPPTRRTFAKGDRTREAIVAATIRLLGTVGEGGTTIRAVAVEAGVAHGTVGFHFGRRDGLLSAAEAEALAALRRTRMEAMQFEDLDERGRHQVDRLQRDDPDLVAYIVHALSEGGPSGSQFMRELLGLEDGEELDPDNDTPELQAVLNAWGALVLRRAIAGTSSAPSQRGRRVRTAISTEKPAVELVPGDVVVGPAEDDAGEVRSIGVSPETGDVRIAFLAGGAVLRESGYVVAVETR
jgi:AcrR family transcriptional regulator